MTRCYAPCPAAPVSRARRAGVFPGCDAIRILLVLSAAAALALGGCGGSDGEQAANHGPGARGQRPAQPPVPVAVEAARTGDISSYYTATATLAAEKEAQILARVSGVVEAIRCEEGDRVASGSVLLTIDNDEYRYRLEQAEANTADLQSRFDRLDEMQKQELVSAEEYETLRNNLKSARAEEGLARLTLSYTAVTSPFNGAVVSRLVDVGQNVSVGTPSVRPLRFRPAPGPRVRAGQGIQETQTRSAGQPGAREQRRQKLGGRIKLVSPVIDPSSGTIKVTIEIPEFPDGVRPGEFAEVRIVTESRTGSTLVPKIALVTDRGEQVVYVAADSTAERRVVEVGFVDDDYAEILDGVSPEDPVVVKGQRTLKHGSPDQGARGRFRRERRRHRPGQEERPSGATEGLVMRGLIAVAVRRRVTVVMTALAVAAFGVVGYQRLPLELFPDIAYPSITVQTDFPDTAPQEVENLITRPVEEAVGVLRGLQSIHSVSRPGVSEVTLEFAWDSDMDMLSMEVREKLDRLILPEDSDDPIVLRFDPSLDPIMRLALSGSGATQRNATPRRPKTQAGFRDDQGRGRGADQGRPRGRGPDRSRPGTPGRARHPDRPGPAGSRRLQRQPARWSACAATSQPVPDSHDERVRHRRGDRRADHLAGVRPRRPAAGRGHGANGDEGTRRDHAGRRRGVRRDRHLQGRRRQHGDGGQARTREDGRSGKASCRRDTNSPCCSTSPTSSNRRSGEVRNAAVIGGVLAIIVLFLFLRDPRSTIIIATSIPLSVIATFLLMYRMDISLNIMSLGGLTLGIGMLVDNSIVVLESIFRRKRHGCAAGPGRRRRRPAEVGPAVVASTLTTVAVFLPIVFVEGIAGTAVQGPGDDGDDQPARLAGGGDHADPDAERAGRETRTAGRHRKAAARGAGLAGLNAADRRRRGVVTDSPWGDFPGVTTVCCAARFGAALAHACCRLRPLFFCRYGRLVSSVPN